MRTPAARSHSELGDLLIQVRACRHCADLPLGPNPILRVHPSARILLLSQAPSTGAHRSSRPWTDASGTRLRGWMGLDADTFRGSGLAILPVGLCYPGRLPRGGDAPPRPECAPRWHARLLAQMPALRLTLLIGGHAQALRLGKGRVAERVAAWRGWPPALFPLPHPSWRTAAWERGNPWFAAEVLPALRDRVAQALR